MHMQRVSSQNESDFHLEGPEKQNVINIPSSNFHNNGLFNQLYGTMHYILNNSINRKCFFFLISIIYYQIATKCKNILDAKKKKILRSKIETLFESYRDGVIAAQRTEMYFCQKISKLQFRSNLEFFSKLGMSFFLESDGKFIASTATHF